MKELIDALQQFLYLNRPSRNTGDLSVGERMVMMALSRHLPIDKKSMLPSELGIHLGLSRSAVTPLLNSLEAKNYLKREVNPHDRRQILIIPFSDKMNFHEKRQHQIEKNLSVLSMEEQKQLLDLIDKLNSYTTETRESNP
ncbi:MAG: transcriptional regulator [Erysipelotrichaceae bacterium]|nr:MAG: transcriptional [Erysipelotrichaceae bacterium]TXT16427.1 MAG: transcriptional regulator [Erysipelotrichaceae bacterium]